MRRGEPRQPIAYDGGVTLWNSILQGLGWRLGKEAAERAIEEVIGGGDEKTSPSEERVLAAKRREREAREAREAAKTLEQDRKAAARRAKEQAREIDRELEALKEQVSREKK